MFEVFRDAGVRVEVDGVRGGIRVGVEERVGRVLERLMGEPEGEPMLLLPGWKPARCSSADWPLPVVSMEGSFGRGVVVA